MRCFHCGTELHRGNTHMDHFFPRRLGGTSDSPNLVPSCAECNMKKGGMHPMDWAKKRRKDAFAAIRRLRLDIGDEGVETVLQVLNMAINAAPPEDWGWPE